MQILYHHRTRSTDAQRIHILELSEALRSLGHEVDIVSLVPIDARPDDASRDAGEAFWKPLVRRLPFAYEIVQLGYNLVGLPMMIGHMLRKPVDFIYERYSLFNFAGVIAARLFRKPVILEVNSPLALEQARDRDIRLRALAEWTERTICNLATRVVVVSTPLRRIMEQSGVCPEKLVVMSNGANLEYFARHTAPDGLRRSLGLEGCVVAGFVGWFRDWHGLESLIEATCRMRAAGREMRLLLIGDGPAMGRLQELAAARHLEGSVVFTGPMPHAQVPPYLDLIDIAVQPAANEYCCPMKILEYMALGKAIVAPRQDNITELLREREEAEFFSPGSVDSLVEALTRLADDGAHRARLGRQARAAIENRGYLWTNNARRVLDLVRDVPAARQTAAAAARSR